MKLKKIPYFEATSSFPISSTIEYFKRLREYYELNANSKRPWVILEFRGGLPIMAHHDLENNDFWGFPETMVFKVALNLEGYERFLEQYEDQQSEKSRGIERLDEQNSLDTNELSELSLRSGLISFDPEFVGLEKEALTKAINDSLGFQWTEKAIKKEWSIMPKVEEIATECKEFLGDYLSEKFKAICYYLSDEKAYVLMDNPDQVEVLEDQRNMLYSEGGQFEIIPVYVPEVEIKRLQERSLNEGMLALGAKDYIGSEEDIRVFYCDNYLVERTKQENIADNPNYALAVILKKAILANASDIHIQEDDDEVNVRFRINTFLNNAITFPKHYLSRINSVICQYGGIDPLKKLVPQSGRFSTICREANYDVRVSMIPKNTEQSCVLRIHGGRSSVKDLSKIGLSYKDEVIFREALQRRSGIILITGPTGSGKSTTLYAALQELNKSDASIETIEDPVEIVISGIKQFQVRYSSEKEKSLTFPILFREVLRHDPDIIMVGEIRDAETANQAIVAAQTGHLVLSTLHTQDAVGAVPRLLSQGVNSQHLADALILVQAQRLIGTVCRNCRIAVESKSQIMNEIYAEFEREGIVYDASRSVYRAGKCNFCNNSGYEGKHAIFEFFPITEEIREKIASGKSVQEIRSLGDSVGFRSLYHQGLQDVALGKTTYEEAFKYRRESPVCYTKLLEQQRNNLRVKYFE